MVLLLRMAEFIEELKPEVVMMENVSGLAKRGGGEIFERFISMLESCGYAARNAWRVLQMADYGVPQSRLALGDARGTRLRDSISPAQSIQKRLLLAPALRTGLP